MKKSNTFRTRKSIIRKTKKAFQYLVLLIGIAFAFEVSSNCTTKVVFAEDNIGKLMEIMLATYADTGSTVDNEEISINTSLSDVPYLTETKNCYSNTGCCGAAYIVQQAVDNNTIPVIYEFEKTGYTTTSLNVRAEANTDSEIYVTYNWNKKIKYSDYNDDWVVIMYDEDTNKYAYLSKKYITNEKRDYIEKAVVGDTRKSFMDYTTITSVSSPQYKLQHQYAYTSANGVRAIAGRYCIALGSYYTHTMGQYVDLVLENGTVIPCVISDAKSDRHTINNHSLGYDHGATEFIVQTSALSTKTHNMGDISYAMPSWNSNVVAVRIYNKNVFDD